MIKTLVAVAQRAKCRFFRSEGPKKHLIEFEDLVHPESRLPAQEIDTDRAGRIRNRFGQGGQCERQEGPKERAAADFAREVAAAIRGFRTNHGFSRLVLVAEPGFLGMLRANLDAATAKLIFHELHLDIADADLATIERQVRSVLVTV